MSAAVLYSTCGTSQQQCFGRTVPNNSLLLRTPTLKIYVTMAKRLRLCVLAIFFLASLIASAQARSAADSRWTVHVQEDGPHPTNKRINCHALKYFQDTKNLKAFDYGGLLADPPAENPDKVQSERVGEIEGFVVYDVIHTIGCHENCGPEEQFFRLLKMILVERKPGEFCEI